MKIIKIAKLWEHYMKLLFVLNDVRVNVRAYFAHRTRSKYTVSGIILTVQSR